MERDIIEWLRDPERSGRRYDEAADDIAWLRSSLVSLLTLAEAEKSPLTNSQVAAICKVALNRHVGN